MSLLRWKELAKSKSKLGDKINYVHDTITKHNIGEQTSQESFAKVFNPVTSKLDDVTTSNLLEKVPKKRVKKRVIGDPVDIDYDPDVDPFEDMDVDNLFNEQPVLPDTEKQIVPQPPKYEDLFEDILEGNKEIYVDPQYFPQDTQELLPEYDYDEGVDYTVADEDLTKETLDKLGIPNYESVDKVIKQPEMNTIKTKAYYKKIIRGALEERMKIRGYKSDVTKKYNKGVITEVDRQIKNKVLDTRRYVLNDYINHYKTKLEQIENPKVEGQGIKQKGGNVMFFNDPKQLLKKLELIVGEVIAGNTSIKMRNMGVSILDMLLRMATINRPQYSKLYNQYFKV